MAFDVGGTGDIIVHKETGYLAAPYDAAELAVGVEWCVEHGGELTKNCLEKAARDFDEKDIIEKYLKLYEDIQNIFFLQR